MNFHERPMLYRWIPDWVKDHPNARGGWKFVANKNNELCIQYWMSRISSNLVNGTSYDVMQGKIIADCGSNKELAESLGWRVFHRYALADIQILATNVPTQPIYKRTKVPSIFPTPCKIEEFCTAHKITNPVR